MAHKIDFSSIVKMQSYAKHYALGLISYENLARQRWLRQHIAYDRVYREWLNSWSNEDWCNVTSLKLTAVVRS